MSFQSPQALSLRKEAAGVLPWSGLDVEQSGKSVEGGDRPRSGGPGWAACSGRHALGRAWAPPWGTQMRIVLLPCLGTVTLQEERVRFETLRRAGLSPEQA